MFLSILILCVCLLYISLNIDKALENNIYINTEKISGSQHETNQDWWEYFKTFPLNYLQDQTKVGLLSKDFFIYVCVFQF